MKKILSILLLAFACFQASAVLAPHMRYVFIANSYNYVSVTVDYTYDPSASMLVTDGSQIYASWNGGCAGPGGGTVGTVMTQRQDPVTGIWSTTGYVTLVIGPGCESASWVIYAGGGGAPAGAYQRSAYCPCQH